MIQNNQYLTMDKEMTVEKSKIAKILSIQDDSNWEIIDHDEDSGLYLIHHTNQADTLKYGYLRGTIIDIERGVVVCQSSHNFTSAVSNEIVPLEDGNIRIIDQNMDVHTFEFGKFLIRRAFEGTVIRAFKHDGKVYFATHRRLNPEKSRWGTSETFLAIYQNLNGPKQEQLFPVESKYSPWCYTFMIMDPKMIISTKQHIGSGYIVLLSADKMWSYTNCPFTDMECGRKDFNGLPLKNSQGISWKVNTPFLHCPSYISIKEANSFLTDGFYVKHHQPDQRLKPGESVMIYGLDNNGKITKTIRVMSQSYNWRTDLRDNNPNLLNQFYRLVSDSYLRSKTVTTDDEFRAKYPILPYLNVSKIGDIIRRNDYILMLPPDGIKDMKVDEDKILSDVNKRYYQIWLSFLLSVPLQQQPEVFTFFARFKKERECFINWLHQIETDSFYLSINELPKRIKEILDLSRKKSGYDATRGNNYLEKIFIDKKITSMVQVEFGCNLFRLIKFMNLYLSGETKDKSALLDETNTGSS